MGTAGQTKPRNEYVKEKELMSDAWWEYQLRMACHREIDLLGHGTQASLRAELAISLTASLGKHFDGLTRQHFKHAFCSRLRWHRAESQPSDDHHDSRRPYSHVRYCLGAFKITFFTTFPHHVS
jgi:hypothetical protein